MDKKKILLLDIDALRPDVFQLALQTGRLPHIASIFGGHNMERGLQIPALSTGSSATFCAQASLFTGTHPAEHGIAGNQFLDRLGVTNRGEPRRYGFDMGDILAFDDAIGVFRSELANKCLLRPTFYERMKRMSRTSMVVGNMYSRGADSWTPPSAIQLARLTKGVGPLKQTAAGFDEKLAHDFIYQIQKNGVPDIMTLYFMGMDHVSHSKGPAAQLAYLINHLDGLVGQVWAAVQARVEYPDDVLVVLFSDHGQVDVIDNPAYAMRVTRFMRGELSAALQKLGRRPFRTILDRLSRTDSFIAGNGGSASIYLRRYDDEWGAPPRFREDVLSVAAALWDGHFAGSYDPKLKGAIEAVFVRNVAQEGWGARYQVMLPDYNLVPLDWWADAQPAGFFADPVNRIQNLAGPMAGDIYVLPNTRAGHYFGDPHAGVHGGLTTEESAATLVYGWPGSTASEWHAVRRIIQDTIQIRCRLEGDRDPSVVDMTTGLEAALSLHGRIESKRWLQEKPLVLF